MGSVVILSLFVSCTPHQDDTRTPRISERDTDQQQRTRVERLSTFVFDIDQHTCALYVAVRSRALEAPIAFGRDMEDVTIHWNKCATGNMVACATTTNAQGDTVVTGIPFPY